MSGKYVDGTARVSLEWPYSKISKSLLPHGPVNIVLAISEQDLIFRTAAR
jgi:hypothetical protein